MSKKFKSKWFRVAVEGATTDGRTMERSWIQDMAATYNREKYGARVWLEHFRSVYPDGPFKAYGDVLVVKAEEVDLDGKKKLALFAQIEPTSDLVNMVNVTKQKIYTSIEVIEKFADSGKAYLMGLAVTDSPASLGTEVLSFAAQNPDANPFKGRKESPDHMFAEAVEAELEFEEVTEETGGLKQLFTRVSELLKSSKDKSVKDDSQFSDIHAAVEALATHAAEQAGHYADLKASFASAAEQLQAFADLQAAHDELKTAFEQLQAQLEGTPNNQHRNRPPVTGGNGQVVTDC